MKRMGVIVLMLCLSCTADNGALGGVEEDLKASPREVVPAEPSRSPDPVERIRTHGDYADPRHR